MARILGQRSKFLGVCKSTGDKFVQIVTIGAVSAEGFLVEEPLDPAIQANLIGTILRTNRPTHLAMPAATECHNGSPCDAGGDQAKGPLPTRLLFVTHFYFTHFSTTCFVAAIFAELLSVKELTKNRMEIPVLRAKGKIAALNKAL
jgi:hypothetical protein